MDASNANVIRLQRYPGGVAAGLRSTFDVGRFETVTVGPTSEFGFVGSDPYSSNVSTGLVVPSVPSGSIGNARYLFLLARASFGVGEQSSSHRGARLVGIRQYAEIVARIPARTSPLAASGPPTGSTVTFRNEITNPLWHPFDGNISWHVMVIGRGQRDTRHPANTDGLIYQDALSPALLFQTTGPYTPPNGGRPWGRPLAASLGNIHELRYPWRDDHAERALDIPIPAPCDVVLFASVRQNNPDLNPRLQGATGPSSQPWMPTIYTDALSSEDRFVAAFATYAQYGTIAGSLVFEEDLHEDIP